MAIEQGEDGDRASFNALFRCLQAPERRRVLFRLLEHNHQESLLVPEEVHVGEKELAELKIELHHSHLPMLEEAGLIRWDRDSNRIHRGPRFVEELLASISEHDPYVKTE